MELIATENHLGQDFNNTY